MPMPTRPKPMQKFRQRRGQRARGQPQRAASHCCVPQLQSGHPQEATSRQPPKLQRSCPRQHSRGATQPRQDLLQNCELQPMQRLHKCALWARGLQRQHGQQLSRLQGIQCLPRHPSGHHQGPHPHASHHSQQLQCHQSHQLPCPQSHQLQGHQRHHQHARHHPAGSPLHHPAGSATSQSSPHHHQPRQLAKQCSCLPARRRRCFRRNGVQLPSSRPSDEGH